MRHARQGGRNRSWRQGIGLVVAGLMAFAALPAMGESLAACQRVPLVDADTGAPVIGAEDMVLDRAAGWLYLAAYDRWALEDALAANAETLPQGAIYAAPLDAVTARPERLALTPAATGDGQDFHPHGLSLHHGPAGTWMTAINHRHVRADSAWSRETRIARFRITPKGLVAEGLGAERGAAHPRLCQANNLAALTPRDLLVTRDHGRCGRFGRLLEDVLGLRAAEVTLATLDGPKTERGTQGETDSAARVTPLAADLGFANGIALSPDGRRVAVAATREKAVRIYDVADLLGADAKANGPPDPRRRIRVPGGPDNLSWGPDGTILAALHPALLDIGMARNRWFGQRESGTRVVALNPESGQVRTLIDDPEAEALNAGTTAVAANGWLLVGSVLDDALLVCR